MTASFDQHIAELTELKQRLEQETAQRMQVEAAARQSRLMLDGSADAVFLVDRESLKFLDVNETACARMGYSREELLTMGPQDIYPDHTPTEIGEMIKQMSVSGETSWTLEDTHVRKDGTTFPVELHIRLINSAGRQMFVTVARDITARKRAEQAALSQLKLAETYFNHSVSCLVILDKDYNFIRVNPAYAKACQRDIGDFTGRNHFDLYPSDAKLIFDDVVRSKCPFETFTRAFSFPDQPERGVTYWDWTLAPILDQQGEVEYLVFSLNEVTERKQAELQQLAREKELRESLIRNVHHRIKNNLQGVTGLMRQQIAKHPEIAEWMVEAIGQINSIAIIHGLQGESLHDEPRLCDMMRSIAQASQALTSTPVEVLIEPGQGEGIWVSSEESVPIALILNELIHNAIKHGPPDTGFAPVRVSLHSHAAAVGIQVRNDCAHPAPGFDFTTGKGLGTGLALVKSMLPRQGASLNFTCKENSVLAELTLSPPVVLLPPRRELPR